MPRRRCRSGAARDRPGGRAGAERGVEQDRARARGRAQIAVGGECRAEPGVPAPARAHDAKKAAYVRGDRLGRLAGKHLLEMPARQPILALEEERAGQFQPHTHKRGVGHEDRAEEPDRLVELRFALRLRQTRALHHQRHARLETRFDVVLAALRVGGGGEEEGDAEEERGPEHPCHRRSLPSS